MNNLDMIKELRAITQAGIKDCKDALEETNFDLQKAIDVVRVKGLNIVSGRAGRITSEGAVGILNINSNTSTKIMVEVNCQTDFVANSKDFKEFVKTVLNKINAAHQQNIPFQVSSVESDRQILISTTKENIVIRRWWIEESMDTNKTLVFSYLHSNAKIGTLVTLMAPSLEASKDQFFIELGNDLAMQIAAMNPIAVSSDRLNPNDVERQKNIFETQLTELNKSQSSWPKIIEGKLNKWYTEVCLLDQESVIYPKLTVKQVLNNINVKLGGEVQVVNFVRCQVGEGVDVEKSNLVEEVFKLM